MDDSLTYRVLGAALEVHRALGPGYLESVYQAALAIELAAKDIPFEPQVPVFMQYRGRPVGEARLDFLIDGSLVVELKSVELLADIHKAQVLSYLRATDHQLGLLINFNVPRLTQGVRRVILEPLPLIPFLGPSALRPCPPRLCG